MARAYRRIIERSRSQPYILSALSPPLKYTPRLDESGGKGHHEELKESGGDGHHERAEEPDIMRSWKRAEETDIMRSWKRAEGDGHHEELKERGETDIMRS